MLVAVKLLYQLWKNTPGNMWTFSRSHNLEDLASIIYSLAYSPHSVWFLKPKPSLYNYRYFVSPKTPSYKPSLFVTLYQQLIDAPDFSRNRMIAPHLISTLLATENLAALGNHVGVQDIRAYKVLAITRQFQSQPITR